MDARSAIVVALRAILNVLDKTPGVSIPGAPSIAPSDLDNGLVTLAAFIDALAHGEAKIEDVEALLRAVHKVAGKFEPPMIATAITIAEIVIPLIRRAYSEGLVQGGMPSDWRPGGGFGKRRGEI